MRMGTIFILSRKPENFLQPAPLCWTFQTVARAVKPADAGILAGIAACGRLLQLFAMVIS
jgi:hypothetical protein